MFLNLEQLRELTGLRQPAAQIKWLRKNGISHYVRADGKPIVMYAAVDPRHTSNTVAPDFSALG